MQQRMNDRTRDPRSISKSDLEMLLAYHDQQFVELAYRLFLGREGEAEGVAHHVGCLRSGVSRAEVSFLVGTSPEAQEKGVDQRLFSSYRIWRRVERVPVIGTLLLVVTCLFRFKRLVSELRRIQNAVFGGLIAPSLSVPK